MTPVWIDTDMGFDDLAAVLTVLDAPDWRVEGLSLVAGNAPLEVVVDNARRAATAFDWDVPMHAGAEGPIAGGPLVTAQAILGEDAMNTAGRRLPPPTRALAEGPAVEALARWLRAQPKPATVLALGPLTHLAQLHRDHPDVATRIGDLLWMGGSAGPGNHTAAAEFNAAVDPEAVEAVLAAGLPLRMVGLDACRQVRVQAADATWLRSLGTERAELLADLLLGYVAIPDPTWARPMALYDPTAAAALVRPGCLRFAGAHLEAECTGRHTRGMTVVEWRVPRRAAANAQVATTADEVAVRDCVLGAMARACMDHDVRHSPAHGLPAGMPPLPAPPKAG